MTAYILDLGLLVSIFLGVYGIGLVTEYVIQTYLDDDWRGH